MTHPSSTQPPLGILLDYDGVVAITEDLHRQALNLLLEEMNLPHISHPEYFERYAGVGETEVMIHIFSHRKQIHDHAAIRRYMAKKTEYFLRIILEQDTLAPGFLDFLAAAPAHATLGIVSGSRREEIDANLQKYQLEAQLPILIALDDCEFGKPHPEPYQKAAEKLVRDERRPIPLNRILVVEDAPSGIRSACAAGLPVFAMPTAYSHEELLQAGARNILDQWTAQTWDRFEQALS